MLRALVALTCVFAFGCSSALADGDGHAFGDDLGRFRVAAKLKDSSCGPQALDTPDDWTFDVVMSQDANLIYWNTGAAAVEGKLSADGKAFSFTSETDVPVDAGQKVPLCTVVRGDDATGNFDAEAKKATAFTGTLGYRFSPSQGSDCSDVVASAGFDELPCSITYRMAATWVSQR